MKFKKMYICIITALLLMFAATACADMGTGEAVKNSPETAIEEARKEFKLKKKYAEEITDALNTIDPQMDIESIEEASDEYGICGGRLFRVKTTSGRTYLLNTSMNGKLTNIKDEKTDKYVWTLTDDDWTDDDYVDVWAENVRILTNLGLSEKSAEEIETLLNRAQPDEIISYIEKHNDGSVTVHTESGYVYDIANQLGEGYDSIFER